MRKNGFTLVELIVASMIGTFVALVAVGTLKVISDSAEVIEHSSETAAEVRFASKMLSTDLINLYRDENSKDSTLIGLVEDTEWGANSRVIFHTVGRAKARASQPEGDVYEVEYYLSNEEDKSVLFRRLWPNPDREAEPGGLLTVIAENIDIFEVRFFDGQQWYLEWPEQMRTLPELVEVNIAAQLSSRRDMLEERFVVNLGRSTGGDKGSLEDVASEESSDAAEESSDATETDNQAKPEADED